MNTAISARRRPQARQRGSLLLEAALAAGVAVSLLALTISLNREQQIRADAITLAGEQRLIMDAAHAYILDNRAEIISDLFESTQTGGASAKVTIGLDKITTAGYLSNSFTPGQALNRIAGQNYILLVRAVFRSDTNIPAASLSELDMDPLGLGIIDPRFLDGDISNEELGIEAALFSIGGTPLPPGQGARVVDAIERINAGFIYNGTISSGAGGTMNFDIGGFVDFDEYESVAPGRFSTPIALGSIGLFGEGGDASDADLREVFLRCVGIDPLNTNYEDCITADRNEVFTNIELIPYDSGSGDIDTFPAITGATRLMCSNALGDEGDAVDPDVFLIDCTTTQINGILDVSGDQIRFGGETLAEMREIAGNDEVVVSSARFAQQLPDGSERDLSENVFDAMIIAARETIDVPVCHGEALDGTPLLPRATASVAAALDPWGRSLSGSFATAERGYGDSSSWTADPSGDRWLARIRYTVESNFCSGDFTSPIDIRNTFQNPNDAASAANFLPGTIVPDIPGVCSWPPPVGAVMADVYEFYPVGGANYGVAAISVSCGVAP